MTSSVATKETDMKRLMAIHPIRSIQKVKNLVVGFDPERATPILVGNHGCLLNGTQYIDIDHFWGDNWTFSDAYDEE